MDNMIPKFLNKGYETERLLLRPLEKNDVDDMFEYTSDAIVCKYLNWGPHKSKSETEDFIKATLKKYINPKDIVWGIVYIKKIIGVVRIYNIDFEKRECEISYILNRDYQGKGFMTEVIKNIIKFCFNSLDMNVVNTFYDRENISSFNVMKRCNMESIFNSSIQTIIKGQKRILLKCEIKKEG